MDIINDHTSPQSQALVWILYTDEARICPDDNYAVKQRFILAVMYFSTDGENWNLCNNDSQCDTGNIFLSSKDVCTWYRAHCVDGLVNTIILN